VFEAAGVVVPAEDRRHAPRASAHGRLAVFDGTPPAAIYLRRPDAREVGA
jgi:hypothetical protein